MSITLYDIDAASVSRVFSRLEGIVKLNYTNTHDISGTIANDINNSSSSSNSSGEESIVLSGDNDESIQGEDDEYDDEDESLVVAVPPSIVTPIFEIDAIHLHTRHTSDSHDNDVSSPLVATPRSADIIFTATPSVTVTLKTIQTTLSMSQVGVESNSSKLTLVITAMTTLSPNKISELLTQSSSSSSSASRSNSSSSSNSVPSTIPALLRQYLKDNLNDVLQAISMTILVSRPHHSIVMRV